MEIHTPIHFQDYAIDGQPCWEYGTPYSMIYDGAQEQVGPSTKFQANLRKYGIHGHTSERERSNQNPAEGVIRELRNKWY